VAQGGDELLSWRRDELHVVGPVEDDHAR
jgi:hypothetical protein